MYNIDLEKVVKLNEYITSTWDAKMKWRWGEAIYGHSLVLLDETLKEEKYSNFLKGFCDYYVENPPKIDESDTVAPALITYAMQKKYQNSDYKVLTDRAIDYIMNKPRLIEDSVNHLGTSLESKFYPQSIWVDSLMMFSVFPSLYAKENNDSAMMKIASRQPRIFAKYMMDKEDDLWYHAYWVKQKTHFPRKKIFWGRGNAWVIASLPMILENIGDNEEASEIIEIFKKTSKALVKYQRADGAFETVFNKVGETYRELSATALIASGFISGYRQNLLDETYLEAGLKALKCVIDAVHEKQGKWIMPEISGPTNPMQVAPYFFYKHTPVGDNWSYGLAALNFAVNEYIKYKEGNK